MQRLLRIAYDSLLLSFTPIISWFLIGIIVDTRLTTIFTLTYPLQFVYTTIKSIFATGANISKEKDGNDNVVMSGLLAGNIVAFIVYTMIALHIDDYITFMHMDADVYRTFGVYSVLSLFICLSFAMMLDKLYYEDKAKIANRYSMIYNILTFVVLIGLSLIIKNQVVIVFTTLSVSALYVAYVYKHNWCRFRFELNLLHCIRYHSAELFKDICMFIIYIIGLTHTVDYGETYAVAVTFASLVTDTQWDSLMSIITVATIDISQRRFDYKQHLRNAYKLVCIELFTSIVMFLCLMNFYDLDLKITWLYVIFEFVGFLLYPWYRIKACYLQLEDSAMKTTIFTIIAYVLRLSVTFIASPFCLHIAMIVACVYQAFAFGLYYHKVCKIRKNVMAYMDGYNGIRIQNREGDLQDA